MNVALMIVQRKPPEQTELVQTEVVELEITTEQRSIESIITAPMTITSTTMITAVKVRSMSINTSSETYFLVFRGVYKKI